MTGDQTVLRDRDGTRLEIARTLRREIERQPMSLAVDDVTMVALSELVLAMAEGAA